MARSNDFRTAKKENRIKTHNWIEQESVAWGRLPGGNFRFSYGWYYHQWRLFIGHTEDYTSQHTSKGNMKRQASEYMSELEKGWRWKWCRISTANNVPVTKRYSLTRYIVSGFNLVNIIMQKALRDMCDFV